MGENMLLLQHNEEMRTPPTVGRMGKLLVLISSLVFCNQVLKDEDSPCIKARLWGKHKLPQM